LDRPDADVNDEMRAPDNFSKVVTAIPALVARGIKVRIATTVESIADAELDRSCALHRDPGVLDSEHIIRLSSAAAAAAPGASGSTPHSPMSRPS